MSDRQKSCAERVRAEFESRMEDLRLLWAGYYGDDCPKCDGTGDAGGEVNGPPEACKFCDGTGKLSEDIPDLGNLYEYGLGFDYVAPDTFHDQPEGYFRYQLSWGGPSDEFRIYAQHLDSWKFSVYKIEYWFLDWFDGAHVTLASHDYMFLKELFNSFFVDSGSAEHVFIEAMKDWEPSEDEND